MPSRQARRERRAAERKAKKHLLKQTRLNAVALPPFPPPCDDDEFTPDFIAYANAMRDRVARRAGLEPHVRPATPPATSPSPDPAPPIGFVSQNHPQPPETPGFVSQPAPSTARSRSEINRANAQHSTGPRSPDGKLASSRNSLKHGLASGALIIPGEDQAAFDALLNDLLAEHQPADTTEEALIHQMAQSFWLAQRALRFQNECFTETGVDEKRLALFLRYFTTHDRAFHKALKTLLRLQRPHHKAPAPRCAAPATELAASPGFVSQNASLPAAASGFVSQPDPGILRR